MNQNKYQSEMKLLFKILVTFCLFIPETFSQCVWDTLADGPPDMQVNTIFEDTLNHQLFVGGEFYTVGNAALAAGSIARFDGTHWSVIGAGAGGGSEIFDFDYYNGKLYAGGKIGINFPGIVTYNPASASAPFWEPAGGGNGVNGIVYSMINYNNKLFMGGIFSIGSSKNVGYWDGNNFGPAGTGIGPASSGFINDLEVYNGLMYVAGSFSTAGNISANNIAKWNGSTWSIVDSIGNLNNQATCMKVFNNELYVGGYFTMAGNTLCNRIAKWNGSAWSAVGDGFDDVVMDINVVNGELYACGYFQNSGSNTVKFISKWDGTSWTQVGNTLDAAVFTIGSLHNQLFVGGQFYNPVQFFTTCSNSNTSVNEIYSENTLSIFPSPLSSNGKLNIEFKNKNDRSESLKLEICRQSGQTIFTKTFKNKERIELLLSELDIKQGIYFLAIQSGNERIIKKVVIY